MFLVGRKVATDHPVDEPVLIDLAHFGSPGASAVAQHRHPVSDLENLFQVMEM